MGVGYWNMISIVTPEFIFFFLKNIMIVHEIK